MIEGLDRAGKSTQHARLCDYLTSQSHQVKSIRFPGKAPVKFLFHSLISKTEAHTLVPRSLRT